jgi:hypothetical protein
MTEIAGVIPCSEMTAQRPHWLAGHIGFEVRRETGKEQSVKVRHDEGVANHIGPEPCVAVREDVDEASVGEGIGQPLSHEIDNSECRRCFEGGRQHSQARYRKAWRPGGVEEPGMCRSSLAGTGRSHV